MRDQQGEVGSELRRVLAEDGIAISAAEARGLTLGLLRLTELGALVPLDLNAIPDAPCEPSPDWTSMRAEDGSDGGAA